MHVQTSPSFDMDHDGESDLWDYRRAMLNILEDAEAEKKRLQAVQTAMLNLLEDFSEEKKRFATVQTATINILEDFDAERNRLEHSQRAVINILEDIGLEKNKLANANERIEATNRELEEFAYAASHDLKAPLRVIDNTSKWIEEDLRDHLSGETRENMDLLRSRVYRMERLLDDLLDYSRVGRVADERYTETLSAQALIDDILLLLSPPDTVTVKVDASFASIRIHRMPLQQIMLNLIGNAIKHHDKKTAFIEVTAEDRGTHYSFAVADDGPGIPVQFHEAVFKMFQTLKPRDQVEGSGMGLAMARKQIERAGGALELRSGEGRGCTFQFTWPKQQYGFG